MSVSNDLKKRKISKKAKALIVIIKEQCPSGPITHQAIEHIESGLHALFNILNKEDKK